MAAEFVLYNPGGKRRKRRKNPKMGRNAAGQFTSKRRKNPGHRRSSSRRRRNPSPALLAPATAAADLVIVPAAAALAGNPRGGRRRRRSYSSSLFGGKRRNPAGGPMDMIQTAAPFAVGVYAGMNLLDRLPGQWGKWARTPLGTAVAAYLINQYGERFLGHWAEPVSMGLLVSAVLRVVQGQSLMGDPMEGREEDAINAVEMDGVPGYFVPEGFEGAFSAPMRHRLPPLRPPPGPPPGPHLLPPPGAFPGGESPADALNLVPPGVPPRFWHSISEKARDDLARALRAAGPAERENMLRRIVATARERNLLGDIDGLREDIARELAA